MAGVMVWSMDTDDFHGDCADLSTNEDPVNFPLMHAINKSIADVLEDIEKNKENEIPHGKMDEEEDEMASAGRFGISAVMVAVSVFFVIYYF